MANEVFKNPADAANAMIAPEIKTNPRNADIDNEFKELWKGRIGIGPELDPYKDYGKAMTNWDKVRAMVQSPDYTGLKHGTNQNIFDFINRNSEYLKSLNNYNSGLKADLEDYKKSQEFKDRVLSSVLNKKGQIPYSMYRNAMRKAFMGKYGYDDTLYGDDDSVFNLGIGAHEGPSMQSPLLRTKTLRNAMDKGIIDLDDIIRYIANNPNRYKGW